MIEILKAVLMGIIEGITEWLPISSTGHMILAEQLIRFDASDAFLSMFRVVIQLGAILAVVIIFRKKLIPVGIKNGRLYSKKSSWSMWLKIVIASIPAVIASPLDDWMDEHFYNYTTVAAALILYGILFLVVDNGRRVPVITGIDGISPRDALIIGLWQVLALVPGTSRSGATIIGGLLLGMSRPCISEFTFFLAVPVMAGASLLKVVKFIHAGSVLTGTETAILITGCLTAFLVSLGCIRFLMAYVKRHSFRAFGIYRIILGLIVFGVAAVSALL